MSSEPFSFSPAINISKMPSEHYKLHYFYGRGRCEPIRYILQYVGVPYEDVYMKFEDWPAMKPKFPLGGLPVLEFQDGRKLCQSLAICRYFATKYGLMSDDPYENAYGDQLAGAVEDMYFPHHLPFVLAKFANDKEKQDEAWQNMKTKGVIPLFQKLQTFLGDKKWFCGNKLHWSDLLVAEYVNRIETIFEKGIAPKFAKLYAHMQRVHELPAIKTYIEKKRPKDYSL